MPQEQDVRFICADALFYVQSWGKEDTRNDCGEMNNSLVLYKHLDLL